MPKTIKVSRIFQEAAEKNLYYQGTPFKNTTRLTEFSCCAVENYVEEKGCPWYDFKLVSAFLDDLGCPTGSTSAFHKFKYKSKKQLQSARIIWLLLAAKVAESEKFTVDAY